MASIPTSGTSLTTCQPDALRQQVLLVNFPVILISIKYHLNLQKKTRKWQFIEGGKMQTQNSGLAI